MYFPAQDTYHDVDVTGGYLDEYVDDEGKTKMTRLMDEFTTFEESKAAIEKFKAEGMPREEGALPSVEMLLNWLAFEEHIPTGKYRVTVYW